MLVAITARQAAASAQNSTSGRSPRGATGGAGTAAAPPPKWLAAAIPAVSGLVLLAGVSALSPCDEDACVGAAGERVPCDGVPSGDVPCVAAVGAPGPIRPRADSCPAAVSAAAASTVPNPTSSS
jgi:hypothetical protein